MSGILFWMIFIQVSIFFIGAGLLIAWVFVESRSGDEAPRLNGRNRYRPRRRRLAMAEAPLAQSIVAVDATAT